MESSGIVGLLIGIGAVAVMFGTLAEVYLHPERFGWLELPRQDPPGQGGFPTGGQGWRAACISAAASARSAAKAGVANRRAAMIRPAIRPASTSLG